MTKQVRDIIPVLEFGQFQNPDDRHRLNEIRELAHEQVADDTTGASTGQQVDRIGRSWVLHADPDTGGELWRRHRTPAQHALEDRLTPMVAELSPQQREAVQLLFYSGLSEHQAASIMRVSRASLRAHRDRALTRLRSMIVTRYLEVSPSGEVTS